jgi:hypothetical protein
MAELRMTDDVLVRYLLGSVSDQERIGVEQRCFDAESDTFAQLEALEDELRFDYLDGRLSASDRAAFERRFAGTQSDRDRLTIVRGILRQSAPVAVPARRSVLLPIAVAATLLLTVTSGYLLWSTRSLQSQVAIERGRASEVQTLLTAPALVFDAGLTRGGTEAVPKLDEAAARRGLLATFRLPTGLPTSDEYVVVLRDVDGRDVWTAPGLLTADRAVRALVPPTTLRRADYEFVLRASPRGGVAPEVASYAFSVR